MKINIIILLFITCVYANKVTQTIDEILTNKVYKNKQEIIETINKYPDDHNILFLKGLFEINGEKAASHFESYYKVGVSSRYMDLAIKRIADYYYSKGMYITAAAWYEKIPDSYPKSKHLEVSLNYYINSLLISGNFEQAEKKIKLYKYKFPNIGINQELNESEPIIQDSGNSKKTNLTFSVLIGNYPNYNTASNYKKMLSKEGFLCRIEDAVINGENYYSLKIGFYKSQSTAQNIIKRLKSRLGISNAIIVENN